MIRNCFITLLAATALAASLPSMALAAESVTARTGAHKGYTRLVLQGMDGAAYHLANDGGGKIVVTFGRPGTLLPQGVDTGADSNVKDLKQVSAGGRLAVEIDVPPGARVSSSRAGGKVIVDVYDPSSSAKAQPPASKPAAVKDSQAAPAKAAPPAAVPPEVTHEETIQPAVKTAIALSPPSPAESAQPPSDAGLAPLGDTITLSSMETFGLAAFTRNGWLWLVADRPGLPVAPQLSGPHKDRYGAFVPVSVQDASAWRLKLPDGQKDLNPDAEGGGLIWRIRLASQPRSNHETAPERKEPTDAGSLLAGSMLWPLKDVGRIVDVVDPGTGETLKVATVGNADQYAGAPYAFVDFDTLPSIVGLAIEPLADDLDVRKTDDGVEIGRKEGLALSPPRDVTRHEMDQQGIKPAAPGQAALPPASQPSPSAAPVAAGTIPQFFDFAHWMMGGPQALPSNQMLMLGGMKDKKPDAQAQDMVTLAKMNLANDRGPEALGFLALAGETLPALTDSPEFLALRGAAEALSGKYELAFQDLQQPSLLGYHELDYWRAYTLAWLEDWKQAAQVMPSDLSLLLRYPQPVLEKLAPKLAEVALRSGDSPKALLLLGALKLDDATLKPWTSAAVDYLEGEADRQRGQYDEAEKLWTPLLKSSDNLYRVRAGLAVTMQKLDQKKIAPVQAIDTLEGLRFAWRGDELEALINFTLGKLYVQQKQYLKGFTILRDAAGMSPDSDIAKDINSYMSSTFQDLLMNDKSISALNAMDLYEQFHELSPSGDAGNKLVQRLAERLAAADLLGKAGDLLENQVDYSLQGKERADVALRLAAIALLNKDPQRADTALDKAEPFYQQQPAGADRDQHLKEITLMRARATALNDKSEDALAMLSKLPPAPDVDRLRVDIAWQAGLWPEAADALQDLIGGENLDSGAKLTDYQADLILNRAVALNLGGDRVELATMREKYGDKMKDTPKAGLFDVVTRPHTINVMAQPQSMQGLIGSTDMFKDFLDDYKNMTDKGPAPGAAGQ
jgi:hypothetical protein